MAGKATRHLHKSRDVTKERLKYCNLVRRLLAPEGTVIIDYVRADADEEFHEIWVNNALGAERNWQYRVFREWSLVQRGIEEMKHSSKEIAGMLLWTLEKAQEYRKRMDESSTQVHKRFWSKLFVKALERDQRWRRLLTEWQQSASNFKHKP